MAKTRDDDPMSEEETFKKKDKLGAGIPFEHDYKNENDDVFTEIRNEWKQGED